MADLAEQIAAADLPAVRKRDLLWALRRISRLSGKPLAAIAADLEPLQVLIAELQAKAAHRLKSKTWSNLRSGLLSALEIAGSTRVLRTHRVPYTSEWKHLISSRPDKNTRYGLTRFGHFCSANGISPRRVDPVVLNLFAGALRGGHSTATQRKSFAGRRLCGIGWRTAVLNCASGSPSAGPRAGHELDTEHRPQH